MKNKPQMNFRSHASLVRELLRLEYFRSAYQRVLSTEARVPTMERTANRELRHDSHTVSLLSDHMVFAPKYRGKILVDDVTMIAEGVICKTCVEMGIEIIEIAVNPANPRLLTAPTRSFLRIHKAICAADAKQRCSSGEGCDLLIFYFLSITKHLGSSVKYK